MRITSLQIAAPDGLGLLVSGAEKTAVPMMVPGQYVVNLGSGARSGTQ
jgi:hypothetical protein